MPFQPGVSGNPSGRPKTKIWTEAIKAAVSTNPSGEPNYELLKAVSEALVKAAKAGDIQAIKEIGDRLEGKVPQTLGQSEDHENLFPTELKVNLVRPSG